MATTNKKLCYAAGCHKVLPPKARKFCSERCRNRINTQKKRAKKKGVEWTQEEDVLNIPSQKNVQTRRGKVYDDLKESGLGNEILIKKMTLSDVAKVLDVPPVCPSKLNDVAVTSPVILNVDAVVNLFA